MRILTKQGLRSTLITVLEFGYKACEEGLNIQAAKSKGMPEIVRFVASLDLPDEIIRIARKK